MKNADLYKGFSAEKQAGYEDWLVERGGEPMRQSIEFSRKSWAKLDQHERDALARELQEVEQSLAAAQREGIDPGSDKVDALIQRHRGWVATMWGAPCPVDHYAGLADLYLSHPDFVARYEGIESGFTAYLTDAMKIHAQRWMSAAASARQSSRG